ncbi:hypothetical protein ACIRPH_20555 [Nocardiopsis sp. NPDC101807]|uniref:hypothetical protein n=1 Tax=Nocardiopsis sp. NPDC101807 TaxID=3364339 RepID=UPI003809F972
MRAHRGQERAQRRELPRSVVRSVFRELTEPETDPLGFGSTALAGSPEVRRLRVGDHRWSARWRGAS